MIAQEREAWPTDTPDYPRRLCQRETWINLNGPWRFHIDREGRASHPRQITEWEHQIEVPYAPESELSGIADTGFHSHVWYEREFELERGDGGPVRIHFGAVDYRARVWVNDVLVGEHEGGHTPFSFDIADALVGDVQRVTVWAQDDPQGLDQPRGKQDWKLEPHSIWYPRTTGIWQTVWVEELPRVYLARLELSPHMERWEIGCEAVVVGRDSLPIELRLRLSIGDRVLAEDRYAIVENEVHRRVALSDPGIDDYRNELLWSPKRPVLIDAEIELWIGDRLLDRVRSYTAIRAISLDRGRMLLNGRPYMMRMVLDQGYWPDSLMTPPSEEAIIRDIELVKAAGFNGVRKHQKIEDPRYLYWADKLGLLVWEEMPSAYRFTEESVRRLTREWMEVIERDISHPCIVTWVPFNESWGVPNLPTSREQRDAVQAMYFLTRTLDPSRPVIGNDGWESSATDIVGIHDYDEDPVRFSKRYQSDGTGTARISDLLVNGWPGGRVLTLAEHPHAGQPVMLTEFGGIAHVADGGAEGTWGYSVGTSSYDLMARYQAILEAVHGVGAFAGFCYTQFTDTFQESNGLFTAEREPKFALNAMEVATRGRRLTPTEVQVAPSE